MATASALPRRDANGRAVNLVEFVGVALGYTFVNGVGLAVIDLLLALLGFSEFGDSSGWLMLILPGLLFFDDLRAWRGHGIRFLVAILGGIFAIVAGLLVAGLTSGLPPILSGGLGAFVAVAVYAPLWFLAIRWLTMDRS